MNDTDKSLIDAHRRGDPEAFGQLVRRYGDGILGYLIRMTGDKQQAEDFFQETFKRVHEKSDTLRGEGFKSWLFKVATNVAYDGFRKDKLVESYRKTPGQPLSRRLRVFSVRTLSNGSKSWVCFGFTILCIIAPSICYKRGYIVNSLTCMSTLKLL